MNRQTVSPAAIEQREVTILLKRPLNKRGLAEERRSGFNARIGVIICLVRNVGEDLKTSKQHF